MSYFAIRDVHITCVILSISLFVLRGGLQLAGVNWRRWKLLRFTPHIIDTVLLSSAIWLASLLHQYPFVNTWLTAKFLALVAYVLFGKKALMADAPALRRAIFLGAALLTVSYIVGVALTHSASWGMVA
ncbi:SirB2 family protein [Uliginosibacterium gangwonense]|uniref:SirB2 family protein n=1 Tax=Uliginosibacterium gangwonense TaxID=392736 RepID=UPI00036FB01C|nr:SirB2 family protein [Uliginosibacterium gangwonense]